MKKRIFRFFFAAIVPKTPNLAAGTTKAWNRFTISRFSLFPAWADLTGIFVNCGHGWAWKNSNCKKFLLQKPMILLELLI
jgi:hypothetical protein